MAEFICNLTIQDNQSPNSGETTKRFVGDFADFGAAATAMSALITDLDAAMLAKVTKTTLGQVFNYTPTIAAGSNVFLQAIGSVPITVNKNATLTIPSPAASLQVAGGSLNTSATAWTDLLANFTSAGGWTISDGENVDTSIGNGSGRVAYVRSGKTNFD